MTSYKDVECPMCGEKALIEWHDDGTVSQWVDVSEYDVIEIHYTEGTDSDADGYVHGVTGIDRGESG